MASILQPSRKSVQQISPDAGSSKFWRSNAPQGVRSKDAWNIWSNHLAKRRTPKPLGQLDKAERSPLVWGLDLLQLAPQTVDLLAIVEKLNVPPKEKSRPLTKAAKAALSSWLEGSRALPQTVDFAIECLAVTHLLPLVAHGISEELWWELVDALWQVARSAADWRADAELPAELSLAQQLLAAELPLTLAYSLPEIRPVYKLRTAARDALSEGLLELLNGDGLMRGSYLGHLRPLLACWTRCRAIGASFKKNCWSKKAEEQFQCLTTHALSLSSAAGTPMLAQSNSKDWTPDFLQNVLRFGGNTADFTAARKIFGKKLTRTLTGKQGRRVPETSNHCEWAGLATMRTEWQRDAPTLAIDFSTPTLRLEVWTGTQRLISGAWSWKTSIDGKQLEPIGSWEETCWFSDADVDYLELSIDLTGGARLERQILLARNEMFLLLADYILGTTEGEILHRYRLPMDSAVEFLAEKETREGLLMAKQPVARILPLALPEWRADPRVGELSVNKDQLQLRQQRQGRNLASPMLIDLKKSRATKPCTWRQLTIAQSLEIQPLDVAVGYRAQCGKQQWLIYRSLDKPANRTLLGQNLSLECLVAKFLAPSGEIDELLEVEG